MILAARIREAFGLPGMTVEQTVPFRDKERMKQVLDAAGHPHPVARRARRPWPACGRRPSGSATRSSSSPSPAPARPTPTASTPSSELADVLPLLRHVPEVSVEEFVDGEELTLRHGLRGRADPVREHAAGTARGRCRCGMHEWVSPVSIVAARPRPCRECRAAARWAREVLAALGFRAGFTHMEWYRKARRRGRVRRDRRPAPGRARRRHDELRHATATCTSGGRRRCVHGHLPQPVERQVQRRQHLQARPRPGRITAVEGLDAAAAASTASTSSASTCCRSARRGATGAPRSSATACVVVRHPELAKVIEMTDALRARPAAVRGGVDGDVPQAAPVERLARPATRPFAQPQPRKSGHEVQLAGPDVARRQRVDGRRRPPRAGRGTCRPARWSGRSDRPRPSPRPGRSTRRRRTGRRRRSRGASRTWGRARRSRRGTPSSPSGARRWRRNAPARPGLAQVHQRVQRDVHQQHPVGLVTVAMSPQTTVSASPPGFCGHHSIIKKEDTIPLARARRLRAPRAAAGRSGRCRSRS